MLRSVLGASWYQTPRTDPGWRECGQLRRFTTRTHIRGTIAAPTKGDKLDHNKTINRQHFSPAAAFARQ